MKHLLAQWGAVCLVLVSATGCGDQNVDSSATPASSPVAASASVVTADDAAHTATKAADAATTAAKAADATVAATAAAKAADAAAAAATAAKAAEAAAVAANADKAADATTAAVTAAKAVNVANAAVAAVKADKAAAAPPPFAVPAPAAADAAAAQALFKRNSCNKCHAVDRTKTGPSLQKIAAKYRGKADGQETVIKNITTAPKIKLDDGSEEEHKVIDTKDQKELKNLSDWILSQ